MKDTPVFWSLIFITTPVSYTHLEVIRNVEQSLLRGGSFSFTLKSFNPPSSARNWANRYVKERRDSQLIHHSTYLTTPKEWLGPRFLADAERLKAKSETSYRHEYLGEVVGSGTQVFENLKLEPIPDEMVHSFDRRLHGVDWGYYPDPWAYNGMQYDCLLYTSPWVKSELRENKSQR